MTTQNTLNSFDSSEGFNLDSIRPVLEELTQAYKEYKEGFSKAGPSPQVWLINEFRAIVEAKVSVPEKLHRIDAFESRLKEKYGAEKNRAYRLVISDFIRVNLRDYRAHLREENDKTFVPTTHKSASETNGKIKQLSEPSKKKFNPDLSRIQVTNENRETKDLGFERIAPNQMTSKDIERFFSRLYKIKNPINGKPFLSRLKTKALLKQSIGSKPNKNVKHKLFDLNMAYFQKDFIKSFVYRFYQDNDGGSRGAKAKYVNFLKANVKGFQSNENLYKDMRAGKNKNPNPLLKNLQKT